MFENLTQPHLMRLSLNREEDYDIFTALRGPDDNAVDAPRLKHLTTCVIRWFVGMKERTRGGGVRGCIIMAPELAFRYCNYSGDGKLDSFIKACWGKHSHFRPHTQKAFVALIGKGVPGAEEYWTWLSSELEDQVG